jgi:BA14K-like protein
MRMFLAFVFTVGLSLFAGSANAGTQSFCERFAKGVAHANASDVDTWIADYRTSYKECIAPYELSQKTDLEVVETTKVAEATVPAVEPEVAVEPVPASAPVKKARKIASRKTQVIPARFTESRRTMVLHAPGSIAWNNYCAARYPSFDRLTGNYKSGNGQERRCIEKLE